MSRVRIIGYGAAGLAVVLLVYLLSSGSSSGYKVYAEFRDVDGLKDGATVKVAGVPSGLVTKLVVTPQGTAMATLTLDPGAAPIGTGASAQVRPTDLLGEHYAQLNVGDLSKPLPSGSFIPLQRTSVPVELDQVLNMLNTPVRTRLRILINEAGVALNGQGANFNQLLADMPPDLGQAQAMLGQISSENVTLEHLIDEGDQVTSAVDLKRQDLGQFIATGEQALDSVAIKQAQLSQTLDNAPGGLSQLRSTLQELQGASAAIIPAANELRATSAPLTATLKQLPGLATAADPTLVTARAVAPALERLGREGQAPLKALRPTASDIQTIATNASPIIGELNSRGMRDVLWFIENWSLATQARDGLGHFVGADLELDSSVVTSALASFLNDGGTVPSAQRGSKPAAAGTPAKTPTATLAGLATAVTSPSSKTLGGVTGVLNKTTTSLKQTVGAVTGAVAGVLKNLAGKGQPSAKTATTPSSSASSSSSSSGSSGLQGLLNYLLGK